jgi:murein DD-endopeptidase MepM/ murein hydrolase activator NlpD
MKELPSIRGREYDFVVYSLNEEGHACIMADNRREAPVSVHIDMTREDNVVSDHTFPLETVVPPNTRQCVAKISRLYKDRDQNFQYSNAWMPGDYTALHNSKGGYRLPWQTGESYPVTQAYGGPITTHTDRSSRFAVDFGLPEGTPVLAARTGVVVNLEDFFTVGGLDRSLMEKANFVDILHDDGTIATYSHLSEHGVSVHLGQMVLAGEKLGISGSTGYSSGPHLHFVVWRPEYDGKGFMQVSIPVEFCIGDRVVCAPVEYGSTVPHRSTASNLGSGKR